MVERWAAVWQELTATPLLWMVVTLLVFLGAQALYDRVRFPLLNPVLTSIAVVVALLLLTGTPYDTYFEGNRFIHFLLGPATVALAVPLYTYTRKLQQMLIPVLVALFVGCLTAIASAVALAGALGASRVTLLSLIPKSVTTPIAMGVSEKIGGLPSLTAVLVILTGIVGAVSAQSWLDLLRIKDPSVRGFAIGLASHGIGTARAFQMDEETGAFSGLAMGLNGALTAFLVPLILRWLGWS